MGKEGMEAGRGRRQGVVKGTAKQPVGGGGKRWFYILLALLLVAGIGWLSYVSTKPPAHSVWQVDSSVALVPNQGHVIGSDTAPLEVVEFADFECPACGSFATLAEPDVRARLVNTGVIRFRFMDLPLNIHRNTRAAHGAAWCAGEQGKFWEMHDIIFQNQDRWNGETTSRPQPVLTDLARQIGVNMPQFESCMTTGKYAGQIQANFDEAVRRSVPSTPTFFFGNRRVTSALPYDQFKRHVDEVLAEKRKTPK